MAKAKKETENNFSSEPVQNEEVQVEYPNNSFEIVENDPPIANEHHTVVRKWTKKVAVEPEFEREESIIEIKPEPLPVDPIEELLKEIGATSGEKWSMTVARLPNYEKDNNCSPRARQVVVGTLPFDHDYVETIQTRFAVAGKPNDFLVCIRRGNRIHSYLPVVQVEAPWSEQSNADAPQGYNAIPAAVDRDPFAEFTRVMKMIKQANEALGVNLQTTAPPSPPEPEKKITTEQALMILAKEDPEEMAKVRDRIFGRNNRDDYEPREASGGMMEALLQQIAPGLNAALPLFAQAAMAWAANQMTPANTSAASSAPPLPPPAEPMPQAPPPLEIQLSNYLLNSCQDNRDVKTVIDELKQYEAANPAAARLLDYIAGMDAEPALDFMIGFIPPAVSVKQSAHALNWMTMLQKEMSDDEEETEAPKTNG